MKLTDQQRRDQIREYLKTDGCNQIKGFYDLSGYWSTSTEALKHLSPDTKDNLNELWGEMHTITEESIKDLIISYNTDWLNKYGKYDRLDAEKHAKYQIQNASTIAHENFEILDRTRFFTGLLLGYIDKRELNKWTHKIRDEELNSTFWKDEDTKLSNCIFRLNILYTYIEYTDYAKIVKAEIKSLAKERLELNGVDKKVRIGNLSLTQISELIKLSEDN